MKPFCRRFLLFVFAGTVVCHFFAAAAAARCLEPSPTLKAGKDPYDDIETRELTSKEHDVIKTMLHALEGEWSGTVSEMICTSISDPSSREKKHYEVKADIEMNYYGDFTIDAHFYDPEARTRFQEIVRLYLREDKLRLNNDSAMGDIELLDLKPNMLRFRKNRLNTMQDGASLRQEFFYTIAIDSRKRLKIERNIYFQARFYSGRIWTLAKE